MSKVAKKVSSFVLPNLGFVGGATNALLQGEGLKGALKGGLKSAATAAATIAAGNLLGGAGRFFGGGVPGLGSPAGTALDKASGIAGLQGPTQGSGIIGGISRAGSGLANAFRGGLGGSGTAGGGGLLSIGNIGTALSGLKSYDTQDELEKELLAAQGRARGAIAPYEATGRQANTTLADELASGELGAPFKPGDLTNEPGYQFRLAEGQKALERSLAARGLGESGAALKAAQEYGQGLADQTYNDAYNRYLQQQQQRYGFLSGQSDQGLRAAGGISDIYGNEGNIRANADVARNNILTGSLASILRGGGAQRILYIDSNGNPVYDTPGVFA